MINKLIELSIQHRWLVLWLAVAILDTGSVGGKEITVDAIPDLSDTQVIIQTEYSGQPAAGGGGSSDVSDVDRDAVGAGSEACKGLLPFRDVVSCM